MGQVGGFRLKYQLYQACKKPFLDFGLSKTKAPIANATALPEDRYVGTFNNEVNAAIVQQPFKGCPRTFLGGLLSKPKAI